MDTTRSFRWERAQCTGNGDELNDRFGFSATVVGGFVFVVGQARRNHRLSVLDLRRLHWTEHAVAEKPCPRNFHRAVLFNDKLICFGMEPGGLSRDEGELCALDLLHKEEYQVLPTYNDAARPAYHACNAVELDTHGNRLVVLTADSEFELQFRLLHLGSFTWEAPKTTGTALQVGGGPTLESCISGSRLWACASHGLNGHLSNLCCVELDGPNKFVWTELECGQSISALSKSLNYVGNGRIVIYGAYARPRSEGAVKVVEEACSPTARLHVAKDTRKSDEDVYVLGGENPAPRSLYKVLNVQDKLLMLGGTANERSNFYFLSAD